MKRSNERSDRVGAHATHPGHTLGRIRLIAHSVAEFALARSANVQWSSADGGRFIVLPDSALGEWGGCPGDGRDPLDVSHDYGRACSIVGYADILSVGNVQAMVYGENHYGGVWLEARYPILFEWIYAKSEAAVIDKLFRLPVSLKVEASIRFDVSSDHLIVFDSAVSGCEIETAETCRFPIQPRSYEIATSIFEPDGDTSLIIHRFIPD